MRSPHSVTTDGAHAVTECETDACTQTVGYPHINEHPPLLHPSCARTAVRVFVLQARAKAEEKRAAAQEASLREQRDARQEELQRRKDEKRRAEEAKMTPEELSRRRAKERQKALRAAGGRVKA